jgi:hypothetical protein
MPKIGLETRRNINYTQELVISAVCDLKEPLKPVQHNFFETISSSKEKLAKFGEAGNIIKNYVSDITISHPELKFSDEWDKLANDVLQHLDKSESIDLFKDHKSILRKLICPKPRFVRDSHKRSQVREAKNHVKNLSLKQVYMFGENGFYGKPDNFNMYVRNSKDCSVEISKLEEQKKIFGSHNMPEVSHVVQKRINSFEEMKREEHFGFHRMHPCDAAIILARMHGIKWHELYFLTVPFNFFEANYWENKEIEKEKKDEMKQLLVMKDRKSSLIDKIAFTYQPRLYPLSKFPNVPNTVVDILTSVEAFGELNECPLFDYYWVLVPSINVNHPLFRNKDSWGIYIKYDLLRSFTNEWEAAFALDTTLVNDGYFTPIVLGESEGKCYFLCMWK